ncbi:MAG: hypothetical protein IIA62_06345 [Nitrospinae bacterium]|nr:hypothetical protein [Nitrospinota bacterium]
MKYGLPNFPTIILFSIAIVCWSSVCSAFDDDSTDHSRSPFALREICENGRVVQDTKRIRFSCRGDPVYLGRKSPFIYKNEKQISAVLVLDFKVARDGKVFYRSLNSRHLYSEEGRLGSGASGVKLYLVSSAGDVVYLNEDGKIFKNGKRLNQGASRISIKKATLFFRRKSLELIINPAVSINGKAIYINDHGDLYADGNKISRPVNKVVGFKINSHGDIAYMDNSQRLFFNQRMLSDGRSAILDYQLSPTGELAFLTDARADNLNFRGKVQSSGSQPVINFRFTSEGDIIYEDAIGRLWRDGSLLND